jgi:hypothetical protein
VRHNCRRSSTPRHGLFQNPRHAEEKKLYDPDGVYFHVREQILISLDEEIKRLLAKSLDGTRGSFLLVSFRGSATTSQPARAEVAADDDPICVRCFYPAGRDSEGIMWCPPRKPG